MRKEKENSKRKTYKRRRPNANDTSDKCSVSDINNNIDLRSNDPAWYMHNESLANAAGSVPFSYALGNNLNILGGNYVVPGIMELDIVPAFGRALTMNDPINIAAVKEYTYVRHQNSGHANYDHPDLMMYILAMGQLYSCHEWMKRMYGYLNTYSVSNRYIPRAYAEVDYIDFADFLTHLPDLQYYINEVAVKLSAFAIPQNFDLFKRHRFMYSNIYADDRSSRAGLYMFTPAGFYKYDNTSSETGTSLQFVSWTHTGTKHTYNNLVSYVNGLCATVFGDEDAGIMSGDILKAYGNEAIYNPGAVTYDYSVLPTYDENVLNQIHNATIFPGLVACPVNQTGTGIIQNQQLLPVSEKYPREGSGNLFLDTHFDNPTAADVLEMSRLTAYKNTIAGNDQNVAVISGSEIVSNVVIYTFDFSTNTYTQQTLLGFKYHIDPSPTTLTFNAVVNKLNALSKFNAHMPMICVNDADNGSILIMGDVDNVTAIDSIQLDNIHMTALLSLFGV